MNKYLLFLFKKYYYAKNKIMSYKPYSNVKIIYKPTLKITNCDYFYFIIINLLIFINYILFFFDLIQYINKKMNNYIVIYEYKNKIKNSDEFIINCKQNHDNNNIIYIINSVIVNLNNQEVIDITKIFLTYDLYFPVGLFFFLNKINIYNISNFKLSYFSKNKIIDKTIKLENIINKKLIELI